MKNVKLWWCCLVVGVVWVLQGAVGPGGASSAGAECSILAGSVERMKCEVRSLLTQAETNLREAQNAKTADARKRSLLKTVDSLCRDISLKILELSKRVQTGAQAELADIQQKIDKLQADLKTALEKIDQQIKSVANATRDAIAEVIGGKIREQAEKLNTALDTNLRNYLSGLERMPDRTVLAENKFKSAADNMFKLGALLKVYQAFGKVDTATKVADLEKYVEALDFWKQLFDSGKLAGLKVVLKVPASTVSAAEISSVREAVPSVETVDADHINSKRILENLGTVLITGLGV